MEKYELLEKEVGAWAGFPSENVVACSSGTAALHLAFEALQLPPGSTVLVPDFTMIACPRAVTLAGLKPVFVDCGSDLNMDMELACQSCYENKPKGLLIVHIYGRQCNMYSCETIRQRFKIPVVEDLAEAHGVKPHPDTDAACWSFFKNKIVHGEEGGAVAFRDAGRAALARQLRCLGFTPAHDFVHLPRGHNYKFANALASMIVDSLRDYPREVARRRRAENLYNAACQREWMMPPRDAPWVYDVRVPGLTLAGLDRVVGALNGAGIAARHAFKPMSVQWDHLPRGEVGREALRASWEIFYLPLDIVEEGQAVKAFDIVKAALG